MRMTRYILEQTYGNKELVFIENGSTDNSWRILKDLAHKNSLVKISQSCRGTSLARAEGIRQSSGKYIIFADQDDHYKNRYAIEKMIALIQDDDPDVAQFGYYTQLGMIKRKKQFTDHKRILTRKMILDKEIAPVVCSSNGCLSPNVWTKIYKTDVLKGIVDEMTHPLFYCEDMYLNTLVFFSPIVQKTVVYPEAFYMWQLGVGTSGSEEAGEHLFQEYAYLKPLMMDLAEKNHASPEIKMAIEEDVLWFYGAIIRGLIHDKKPEAEVLKKINQYESYAFIRSAKKYVRENGASDSFLASNYTSEQYLLWQKEHFRLTTKEKIRNETLTLAKRIIRSFAK